MSNTFLRSIEDSALKLNTWDKFPVVSTLYSGPGHVTAGLVQIVAGTVFFTISVLFGYINDTDRWIGNIKSNFTAIYHGIGNLCRGTIVFVPLLGNLIIYLYDISFLGKIVLSRDWDGKYTLTFGNDIMRGTEINFRNHTGCFNTKKAQVPHGYVLVADRGHKEVLLGVIGSMLTLVAFSLCKGKFSHEHRKKYFEPAITFATKKWAFLRQKFHHH